MKNFFKFSCKLFTSFLLLFISSSGLLFAQNGKMGIGTTDLNSKLGIAGNVAIGSSYGSMAAPANGAIIEGNVGIGTNTINPSKLSVAGNLALGSGYSTQNAPANGAIIEGNVGIGTNTINPSKLSVAGNLALGSGYSTQNAPANGAIIEGNVGIGTNTTANKLDVEGGLAVGAGYAGTIAAPANGAIFEGAVGIGTPSTTNASLSISATPGNWAGNFLNNDANRATLYLNNLAGAAGRGLWIENGKLTMNNGNLTMNSGTLDIIAPSGQRAGQFTNDDPNLATIFINNFNPNGRGLWIENGKFTMMNGSNFTMNGGGELRLNDNGQAYKSSANWTVPSDKRLKTDIKDYMEGLQQVRSIHPVTFHYNGKENMSTKPTHIGVIAQEVEAIAPHMVNTTDNGYLAVDPSAFTYMLINAVKELDETVQKQQATIETLQAKLDAIEKALAKVDIKVE